MKEDSVPVAAEKGWKNFEAYAREIMRRFYAPFRLDIKDTPWSHDEGRDGDAVYVFASACADGITDDLALVVKLWVEVKLRNNTTVSLHDVGNHLVRAENQKVNKLVFVTNGTFAPETREQLDIYCMNRHLSCTFVDGARLEALRISTSKRGRLGKKPRKEFVTGSFDVLVRLSSDPLPRDLHPRGQVCSKPEAPVFLILDVVVKGNHANVAPPIVRPPEQVEHCIPYQSSFSLPLISGERFRAVYAVWGRAGASFGQSDFVITFPGVPDQAVSLQRDTGHVTIGTRFLAPHTLASQDRVAVPLRKALSTWLASQSHAVYAIEAPAGAGKSYVVQELRRQWLGKQIREIWLDGGCHNDAWSIVVALAGSLFPVTILDSANQGEKVLERWLMDAGVADLEVARSVARQLTTIGASATPNWAACVGILASLLRQASAQSPVMLVYEDLHKASPSAVLLMRALLGRIGHEGVGNSFMLLTTRPTEQVWRDNQGTGFESEPGTVSTPLDQLLSDLGHEGKLLAMERPRTAQARDLLAASLPYVEVKLLESMIDQVGTTPFALKELMAYLATIEAIEPIGVGTWQLVSAGVLNQRFNVSDLQNATADRLTLLVGKWQRTYPWLDDFLLAGALLGRDFATVQALEATDTPSQKLPSSVLDLLFSGDVAQPGSYSLGSDTLRFTHDLIRVAFLKRRTWASSSRLAGRLLRSAPASMPALLRCRLARNAGDIARCRSLVEGGYASARAKGQHWDALQFRLLGLWALDPARASQLLDESNLVRFITIDPALEIGPSDTHEATSREQITAALFDCLESVTSIGFGGGKVVDALMTEAAMLVRLGGNDEQKARLDYYAGRVAFDADDFRRSLECHTGVEQIHSTIGRIELLNERKENLNRLFLCQRQLDLPEDAQNTLEILEQFDTGDSPEYSARMQAYRGYLHLYQELSLVPDYWKRAADIAMTAGNHQRFAHHAIGRAWALLLLDEVEQAAAVFMEIEQALSGGTRLQGIRMRLDLDAAALAMVRQDWREAEARLYDSLNQGLQLDIFRRLWRIEANLATLYEALGDFGRCTSYDRRAIQGVLVRAKAEQSMAAKAPWLRQRHALPVLNLALRIRAGVSPKTLLEAFSAPQQAEINRLADLVQTGRVKELTNCLAWHCKSIAGNDRFILTE